MRVSLKQLIGGSKVKIFQALLIFLASASAHSGTVTVDFEGVADGPVPASFNTQGYTFISKNSEGIGVVDDLIVPYDQSLFFCMDCQDPAGFDMHATNNALFSLYSFDMGFLQQDPMPLTITGTYADNSEISITYNSITGLLDTIAMDAQWQDLKSVSFAVDTSTNYAFNVPVFDNIVVTNVPVPAAVWLFGSALAGLGWFRRRQTA
jgi:hypothetical protein